LFVSSDESIPINVTGCTVECGKTIVGRFLSRVKSEKYRVIMDSQNDTPLGFWGSESDEIIARQFPLHRACRDGDVATLSRLVAEATREQMLCEDRFYGWTPLHWSAYFGKNACLNGLLSTGMNVNLRTSRFQQTPAHVAAFGGHPLCLQELVKKGADFHAKDYLGETPLHKAARVGNIECIKTLVSNGAQIDICNSNGHSAADLARMQNFLQCHQVLTSCVQQQPHQNGHHMNGNGHNHHNGNGHNGNIMNGASGCMTNGNGVHHSNGNGSTNGIHSNGIRNGMSRKRGFHDESIPQFKRARTTPAPEFDPAPPMVAPTPSTLAAPVVQTPPREDRISSFHYVTTPDDVTSANKETESFKLDPTAMTSYVRREAIAQDFPDMDMECGDQDGGAQQNGNHHKDPSELKQQRLAGQDCPRAPSPGMDTFADMTDLDYGYANGYGDTAECMPDDVSSGYGYVQKKSYQWQGLKNKGWQ